MKPKILIGQRCLLFWLLLSPAHAWAGLGDLWDDAVGHTRSYLDPFYDYTPAAERRESAQSVRLLIEALGCVSKLATATTSSVQNNEQDLVLELLVEGNPFGARGKLLLVDAGRDASASYPYLTLFSSELHLEALNLLIAAKVKDIYLLMPAIVAIDNRFPIDALKAYLAKGEKVVSTDLYNLIHVRTAEILEKFSRHLERSCEAAFDYIRSHEVPSLDSTSEGEGVRKVLKDNDIERRLLAQIVANKFDSVDQVNSVISLVHSRPAGLWKKMPAILRFRSRQSFAALEMMIEHKQEIGTTIFALSLFRNDQQLEILRSRLEAKLPIRPAMLQILRIGQADPVSESDSPLRLESQARD